MSKRKQVTVPMEKIKEQDKYINEIKNENERYFHLTGKKKSYFIQTFGCQMNEHKRASLFFVSAVFNASSMISFALACALPTFTSTHFL